MKMNTLVSQITSCTFGSVLACCVGGCVTPATPVSVSGDGRYIAYASTDDGDVYMLTKTPIKVDTLYDPSAHSSINLTVVILDVKNNSTVHKIETNETPLALTNARNHVAYTYMCKDDDDKTQENILFYNDGTKKIIKDARFPVLPSSGDSIAFTNVEGFLCYDHFKTGRFTNTNVKGYPLAYSPDNKRVLYLKNREDKQPALTTFDTFTGRHKEILALDKNRAEASKKNALPLYPQWIDDNRILLQYAPSGSSNTSEIYALNTDGDLTRITNNSRAEFSPMISPAGVVFYVALDSLDETTFSADNPVYYSRNEKGFWREYKSTFSAQWTRIAGNKLVYVADKGKVYSVPLEDVIKGDKSNIKNISSSVSVGIKVKSFFKKILD